MSSRKLFFFAILFALSSLLLSHYSIYVFLSLPFIQRPQNQQPAPFQSVCSTTPLFSLNKLYKVWSIVLQGYENDEIPPNSSGTRNLILRFQENTSVRQMRPAPADAPTMHRGLAEKAVTPPMRKLRRARKGKRISKPPGQSAIAKPVSYTHQDVSRPSTRFQEPLGQFKFDPPRGQLSFAERVEKLQRGKPEEAHDFHPLLRGYLHLTELFEDDHQPPLGGESPSRPSTQHANAPDSMHGAEDDEPGLDDPSPKQPTIQHADGPRSSNTPLPRWEFQRPARPSRCLGLPRGGGEGDEHTRIRRQGEAQPRNLSCCRHRKQVRDGEASDARGRLLPDNSDRTRPYNYSCWGKEVRK